MWLPRDLSPLAAFHGELDRYGRNGIGIVANQSGFLYIIAADHVDAQGVDLVEIVFHWSRFLARVTAEQRGADLARVQDRVIQQLTAGMAVNGADVVRGGEICSFAWLPHEIHKIGLHGGGAL